MTTTYRMLEKIIAGYTLIVMGCSSSVSNNNDAQTSDVLDTSSDTSPQDTSTSGCPSSIPNNGSTCSPEGTACQFGDDPRSQCRPSSTCTNSQWVVTQPQCPPISPPAMCPATREAAAGQACTNMDQTCNYNGLGCTCTNCREFPVGGCGGPLLWQCDIPNPQQGCPSTIPNTGSSCSMEGLSCYYDCNRQGDLSGRRCVSGAWTAQYGNCPISTRDAKRDIVYIDRNERNQLATELLQTRLATYEYTEPMLAGRRRLGFILEDQPMSYAADPARSQVDLYGYTSMLVATVQRQSEQIEALQQRIRRLEEQQH